MLHFFYQTLLPLTFTGAFTTALLWVLTPAARRSFSNTWQYYVRLIPLLFFAVPFSLLLPLFALPRHAAAPDGIPLIPEEVPSPAPLAADLTAAKDAEQAAPEEVAAEPPAVEKYEGKALLSLSNPVPESYISAPFWGYPGHTGTDYAAAKGSDIKAVAAGTVLQVVDAHTGYGRYLVLDHGNEITTLYAQCDELLVAVGAEVKQGEVIAKVGKTGNATGNHCHVELRMGTAYADLQTWMD